MAKRRTDGLQQTRHVCFLPPRALPDPPVPPSRPVPRVFLYTLGFHVAVCPIRPIRKYSRGVICRGRRCPIGRHRFFRRRAPRASAAFHARPRLAPRRCRVSCISPVSSAHRPDRPSSAVTAGPYQFTATPQRYTTYTHRHGSFRSQHSRSSRNARYQRYHFFGRLRCVYDRIDRLSHARLVLQ